MKKIICLFALVMLISGCVRGWSRPNTTQEKINQDIDWCSATTNTKSSLTVESGRVFDCMKRKGYTPIPFFSDSEK